MTTQIHEAIPVIRAAIYSALTPLAATYLGLPKVYWLVADQGAPLPLFVFQSQDLGGRDASMLSLAGWRGEMTIKTLGRNQAEADALLDGVHTAMAGLTASGFTVTATLLRPLVTRPLDGVWQAGLIYTIELYRS